MSLKINKRDFTCFALLAIPLEPRFFELVPLLSRVYTLLTVAAALYLVATYCINRMLPSRVAVVLIILETWMLVTTVLNGGLVNTQLFRLLKLVILCLTVDLFSDDIESLLKCFLLHFEIYIYANLVTYLLFPGGLASRLNYAGGTSTEWILGWHHYFKVWFIPALLVAWLYREMTGKSRRCYFLSIAIIVTECFFGASTGLTGVILFLILINVPAIKKILTPGRSIALAAFLVITIVFIQRFDYISALLSGIYEDDLTFSGRLVIWTAAIQSFLSSPFIGYGVRSTTDVINILKVSYSGGHYLESATHCHNHILQVLFQGGIFAGVAFFTALYFNLKKCADNWYTKYARYAQICLYMIIVYIIIGITEQYEYVPMYTVLILPWYIDKMKVREDDNLSEYLNKEE